MQCRRCLLQAAGVARAAAVDPAVMALAERAVDLAANSVAQSSASTYATNRRRFLTFCTQELGVPSAEVFPRNRRRDLNRAHVRLFLAYATTRFAPSTVDGTLSALGDWQRARGVGKHETIGRDPVVRRILAESLRRRAPTAPLTAAVKAPLPVRLLLLLIAWMAAKAAEAPARAETLAQDACWLVIGFFGMMRRSELAGLRVGDVGGIPGGGIEVSIRRSKTDQLGAGATVLLARTSGSGVPVEGIVGRHLEFVTRRGAAPGEPLFSRGRQGNALVRACDKSEFTRRLRDLLAELQQSYPQLGLNLGQFSAHSLRRGGATAAANGGVSLEAIKAHGRWKSDAVNAYIWPAPAVRMRIVAGM